MYKMKYPGSFRRWWLPLTRQGDPMHRSNLVGEAFDAGFDAGKAAALRALGQKLLDEYGELCALDSKGRPEKAESEGRS